MAAYRLTLPLSVTLNDMNISPAAFAVRLARSWQTL